MKQFHITILPVILAALILSVFVGSCQMDSEFLDAIDEKIEADNREGSYKVTYIAGDQESGDVPVDEKWYLPGDWVTVQGNTGSLAKEEYLFIGWRDNPDSHNTIFYEGDGFDMPESDVELYVAWMDEKVRIQNPYPGTTNDHFGSSVAISGDYIVVGVPNYNSDAGAVYVYHRTGPNQWDDDWMALENSGGLYGSSVDIDGDILVVGAPGYYNGVDVGEGVVFIYQLSGDNTWSLAATVAYNDIGINATAAFGSSVSLSGDYLAVGAPSETDSGGYSDVGKVHVFHQSGTHDWTSEYWAIDNPDAMTASNFFGHCVSLGFPDDSPQVLIGNNDQNGNPETVYFFYFDGSTWQQGQSVTRGLNESFGTSVSLYGAFAAVGAKDDNSGVGLTFLYTPDADNIHHWGMHSFNSYYDIADFDDYGRSVAIGNGGLLIGYENRTLTTGEARYYPFDGSDFDDNTYNTWTPGGGDSVTFLALDLDAPYAVFGDINTESDTGMAETGSILVRYFE